MQRIRLAASHLLSLIEQILVYARLELGRERMRPVRLRVAEMLREAAGLVEPVAAERGIRFRVQTPGLEAVIESDATKLRQILLNLLANALKFTDHGEVNLSAALVAEQDEITFTVQDTGIGIAPEHLARIFDPFWQVDQSVDASRGRCRTRAECGAPAGARPGWRCAVWKASRAKARDSVCVCPCAGQKASRQTAEIVTVRRTEAAA